MTTSTEIKKLNQDNVWSKLRACSFFCGPRIAEHKNPWMGIVLVFFFCAAPLRAGVIAETIAAESAGEGERGMYAVANVIANRVRAQHKTPAEIVTAKNQFYGYTAKNRRALYLPVKEYCDYLEANIMSLPDITGGALYFRTAREKLFPWCQVFTVKIGNHLFYR